MSEFLSDGDELFAASCVNSYAATYPWWETLLGAPPSFKATPTEAVWEVAPHRWIVLEQRPERAGNATHTLYVTDLDARVAAISARGIEPSDTEVYGDVRKVVYRDPEGNEIGFGGSPV
ncbi:VOC family protein [Promicromonospora sp. NPDC060204]|uniref:VOC family protein n=1 Tax=Promicromonospora sp. NPDC060204 TaxID=3347071 RepID=UPI00365B2666